MSDNLVKLKHGPKERGLDKKFTLSSAKDNEEARQGTGQKNKQKQAEGRTDKTRDILR